MTALHFEMLTPPNKNLKPRGTWVRASTTDELVLGTFSPETFWKMLQHNI
jgi:hypothetical protein